MNEAQWWQFATLTGVWVLAVMLPGPNFLATAHAAATQSRRAGVMTALGIAVGTAFWAAGSLLGLGVLFRLAAWLYSAVKILGGAYLVWIGLRMLLTGGREDETLRPSDMPSARKAFRRGLVVDLSNPKAAAFFASLFAVAIPPDSPLWFKALAVAMVVTTSFTWYSFVAAAVSLPPVASLLARSRRALAAASGALFITLGLRLATDR